MQFDERILEAADQFFQAAKLCGGHGDESGRPEDGLPLPKIVNYAVATELALKGLHWVHLGKSPQGHDLEQICMSLPPALVAELAEQTSTPLPLFRGRLREVRSAFQDWRYAFEKEELGITIAFIANVAAATMEALRRDAASATAANNHAKLNEDQFERACTSPSLSTSTTRKLIEIRLGRSTRVKLGTDGGWRRDELWAPDTPERRSELEVLMKVGNSLFGRQSHWIEEREA